MSASRSNILILGGGVIGLTTAYLLARDGVPSIVLDPGELGKEASWAGAGILPYSDRATAVTPFDLLRALSVLQFPAFSEELRQLTGIDNGYRRSGGLEFVCNDDTSAAADEWQCPAIAVGVLEAPEVRRLEPALNPRLGAARHFPEMAQVRNPRHMQALVAACASCLAPDGWPLVDLRPGVGVTGLLTEGERVAAVATTHGVVEGERVLVAAGAWTASLLRPLGWTLPIEPVRGQIVLLNSGPPLVRHILLRGSRYLVPRADGRILVGSTEEYAGFAKHSTAAGVQGLLELAIDLVPDLASARVEQTWAGLRPGSRDGLPYLGRIGAYENLFVAAGHFRSGLQLSIGTGQIMANLLQDRSPPIEIAAFAPDRFLP
ncbi:MAG: FAD-dependent oxidoreductase [Planctomycetota bacterium]